MAADYQEVQRIGYVALCFRSRSFELSRYKHWVRSHRVHSESLILSRNSKVYKLFDGANVCVHSLRTWFKNVLNCPVIISLFGCYRSIFYYLGVFHWPMFAQVVR